MARYEVRTETIGGAQAVVLSDGERAARAEIFPALGANCARFRTALPGVAPVEVLLPPEQPRQLAKIPFCAGLPLLFPFPNRVRDGVYAFEGRTYRMDRLMARGWDAGAGQALHGLVDDQPWTLGATSADADGALARCELRLDAVPEIAAQYPFPCRIASEYRLRDGVLHQHLVVDNLGDRALPMGLGTHGWFAAAIEPGATVAQQLATAAKRRARIRPWIPAEGFWKLDRLMPTGEVVPVEREPRLDLRAGRALGSDAYDDVWTRVRRAADGTIAAGFSDPDSGLSIVLGADRPFREWVMYAPRERPVIALEPYTCTTDAVNLQARGVDAGLIALAPGATWRGHLTIALRKD